MERNTRSERYLVFQTESKTSSMILINLDMVLWLWDEYIVWSKVIYQTKFFCESPPYHKEIHFKNMNLTEMK